MKDARGIDIIVGYDVVYSQSTGRKNHSDNIAWGVVVKLNNEMIRVETQSGDIINKSGHNVVVVELPGVV